jgi:hypothetical protein
MALLFAFCVFFTVNFSSCHNIMRPCELKDLALAVIACYAAHSLIIAHHVTTCQQSMLSVFVADSAYCRFVWSCVQTLRWLPIALVGPLLSHTTMRFNVPPPPDPAR